MKDIAAASISDGSSTYITTNHFYTILKCLLVVRGDVSGFSSLRDCLYLKGSSSIPQVPHLYFKFCQSNLRASRTRRHESGFSGLIEYKQASLKSEAHENPLLLPSAQRTAFYRNHS